MLALAGRRAQAWYSMWFAVVGRPAGKRKHVISCGLRLPGGRLAGERKHVDHVVCVCPLVRWRAQA
eukprot:11226987-Lingulodinium_polyedra.AAC.1